MIEARSARDRLDRIIAILKRSFRFWATAMLVVFLGAIASLAVAFTRPRTYRSETLILYREGIRSETLGGPEVGDPARKLGLKLKEMILSRTQLQKVIEEFKLYPKIVDDRGYVDAVDEMRKHISFRVKDGDTFGLAFEGHEPKLVQAVTARLAEIVIRQNSATAAEEVVTTKEFLDAEKKRVEAELKEKETNLAKFLAKHPEFARETAAVPGGANQAGTAIRAAAAAKAGGRSSDPALQALEREAARIQERLGLPTVRRRRSEADADPRLVAEKQAAEADLQQALRDLAEKAAQFTEQHPDVRAAKTRAKAAEQRFKRASDAVQANLAGVTRKPDEEEGTIDRATLESQLRKVQAEIAAHRARKGREGGGAAQTGTFSQAIVALETEWNKLNREVQESRERYQQLQTKSFSASMAESAAASGRSAQMVIIDPAFKPTHPAKGGRTLIAGVGLALSIMLSMLIALVRALLDDRLYDRIDIERLRLAPLLGVVPRPEKRRSKRGEHV